VRSLTLVGPALGLMPATPLPLRVRWVGDVVMTVAAPEMATDQLDDFLYPEGYADWVERYEVQMQYEGFRRSMLETMRGDVFKGPATSFTALARSRIPILILWGRGDRTVPFTRSDAASGVSAAALRRQEASLHSPSFSPPASY
jgi:pimeloyl-ACP methyl ester carboxylesterase